MLTPLRLPGVWGWVGPGREALTRRVWDRDFSSRAPCDRSHCGYSWPLRAVRRREEPAEGHSGVSLGSLLPS